MEWGEWLDSYVSVSLTIKMRARSRKALGEIQRTFDVFGLHILY